MFHPDCRMAGIINLVERSHSENFPLPKINPYFFGIDLNFTNIIKQKEKSPKGHIFVLLAIIGKLRNSGHK